MAGSSIFTVALDPDGSSSGVSSVLDHSYDTNTDAWQMADGNFSLMVPEENNYIMLLTGLGMMGFLTMHHRNIFG